MEGHAKTCTERHCELADKSTHKLHKVATPCIDDHQVKQEEMGSVGELSTVCSQIVVKCPDLARIGRPDILWSVNKVARAVTKWTKACDKRLARLISYMHHTSEFKQYCHVGTQHNIADEDCLSTLVGVLYIFGSRTCKKQTSVSHSSTEAEIISLDAFIATKINLVKPRLHQHRETCGTASCPAHERKIKPKLQQSTIVLNYFILIMCLRTQKFLSPLRCSTHLRTMKP